MLWIIHRNKDNFGRESKTVPIQLLQTFYMMLLARLRHNTIAIEEYPLAFGDSLPDLIDHLETVFQIDILQRGAHLRSEEEAMKELEAFMLMRGRKHTPHCPIPLVIEE